MHPSVYLVRFKCIPSKSEIAAMHTHTYQVIAGRGFVLCRAVVCSASVQMKDGMAGGLASIHHKGLADRISHLLSRSICVPFFPSSSFVSFALFSQISLFHLLSSLPLFFFATVTSPSLSPPVPPLHLVFRSNPSPL